VEEAVEEGIGAGGHLVSGITSGLAMPVLGMGGLAVGRKVEDRHRRRLEERDQHKRLVEMLMARRNG
jgi:hypothetical protein